MKQFIRKARKYILKKAFLDRTDAKYSRIPAVMEALVPLRTNFLLITIVFNDAELITLQHRSLKKYLRDDFDYCVVDDSSDEGQANAIREFCATQGVSYVHLPAVNPGMDGSMCHGFALNWTFRNLVRRLKPEMFGFIDPDIILAGPESFLSPWQGKQFWGLKSPSQSPRLTAEEKEKHWRLWPGFCFFRRDFYENKELNFLPVKNIDTGGRNLGLFKDVDVSHLMEYGASVKEERVSSEGPELVQRFGNIVHLVGGVSLKGANREGIDRKREYAIRLIN